MTRCTPILFMCVALISACSSPRKACRKADKHIARAVWLCPDVLGRDSATVTIPPDSVTFQAERPKAAVDSLLAACRTLNAALMAARRDFPVPQREQAPHDQQVVAHAVAKLQQVACDWQPFTERFGRITVQVQNLDGTPLLVVTDPGEARKVPCPPTVNKTVITGVAEWYRTFFWFVVGGAVLLFAFLLLLAATHHAGP